MKVNFHNLTNINLNYYKSEIIKVFKQYNSNNNSKQAFQIIFTTDDQIRELNNNFRQLNEITDVLSFPDEFDEESLGDVFINIMQAKRQASEYQHTYKREVTFLAVHGYLHLIGYDHQTSEDEIEMIKKQKEILQRSK